MDHVAIDLGGRESQLCIRSSDGEIVREGRTSTRNLGRAFAALEPSRVILETCAEAFAVADLAVAAGHEVRIVPATLVRTLGVGSRRTKNDRRDAQVLSEVSTRIDLPSVHLPQRLSREHKAMCAMRESLVSARTQLINSARGWLRTQLFQTRVRTGATETFVRRAREALRDQDVPRAFERLLVSIEALDAQIEASDVELEEVAKSSVTCKRLMSVPGVGPLTAVMFVATIDDARRFESAHKVQAYLGLTPGEDSSSERRRMTSITKAGSVRMRRVLVQAAWSARRARGVHPMLQWASEVEKRRGKRVAVVALARKLAGILYAMWRDGTTYDAQSAAAASAA